jgi:uncharacterized lipoprotein YddW (UPF0748 family)
MEKRDFLKTLGITATGVAIAGKANAWSLFSNRKVYHTWPEVWCWMEYNPKLTDEDWKASFEKLRQMGFEGVLFHSDITSLARVAPIAVSAGIELHSWMWTLNRPDDAEAKQHPDWYVVSRKGESCFDHHPYVDYYQWVCPSKEEVFRHVEEEALSRVEVAGVSGVHLDYVRYPDVILPKALQPNYGLVQDHEMPEYDFCYCETCREKFKTRTGIDIISDNHADLNEQWRQYRYDSVTHFVNRLARAVHKRRKLITAAVFPYPELARTICRQSWNNWDLDAFFPMTYQKFYEEDISWIGKAASYGARDLQGKAKLFSGLYIPDLPTSGELVQGIQQARSNGASGIAIFESGGLKDYSWDQVQPFLKKR